MYTERDMGTYYFIQAGTSAPTLLQPFCFYFHSDHPIDTILFSLFFILRPKWLPWRYRQLLGWDAWWWKMWIQGESEAISLDRWVLTGISLLKITDAISSATGLRMESYGGGGFVTHSSHCNSHYNGNGCTEPIKQMMVHNICEVSLLI